MDYLERYLSGEHERVWSELQALGAAVRQEPHLSQARSVAAETMRRVGRNCALIVVRLRALGYKFGTYPDGSRGYYTEGPLVAPSANTRADCAELEERVGDLPLSLAAFWQEVGSVDWVGRQPGWPRLLDPLVVYPPEAVISDLEMAGGEEEIAATGQFTAGLAPDDLHKDNVSGGAPYGVALPDSSADFVLQDERHGLLFVPYLRLAILRWGGLPGLEAQGAPFAPLGQLVEGLEPF
jgi:hypothetical protein